MPVYLGWGHWPFCLYILYRTFLADITYTSDLAFITSKIAKFLGPTWGPSVSCRPQMGPILVPGTLLSGLDHTTWAICKDNNWRTFWWYQLSDDVEMWFLHAELPAVSLLPEKTQGSLLFTYKQASLDLLKQIRDTKGKCALDEAVFVNWDPIYARKLGKVFISITPNRG